MADTPQPNYPDILGYITGGGRYNVKVVQAALAVRPRVARAGRPFEAILLIQNASDVDVDVTAALQIPEQDAKKQKGRFVSKSAKLVVGMRPAEVGYVVLPLSSLPDTAVGDQYKIGMSIEVKTLDKPKRLRATEGGGEVVLDYLSEETISRLNDLKKLTFSTTRRGLIGSVLEAPFNILSAQIGPLVDFKPGWVSLWKMRDYKDDRLLLDRYSALLTEKVLPSLNREALYPPLFETTRERFTVAGYDIQPVEAHYIAKLLVTILEMAAPEEDTFDYLGGEQFIIKQLLQPGATVSPAALPGWCRALLKAIDADPAAADQAPTALATAAYDELLRDAIGHAFRILHRVTGQDLGSDDDVKQYGERLIANLLKPDEPLVFIDVYLPLVMAGVVYYDRAILVSEKVGEALTEASQQLKARLSELTEGNELVFKMAEQINDRALQKYGYRA